MKFPTNSASSCCFHVNCAQSTEAEFYRALYINAVHTQNWDVAPRTLRFLSSVRISDWKWTFALCAQNFSEVNGLFAQLVKISAGLLYQFPSSLMPSCGQLAILIKIDQISVLFALWNTLNTFCGGAKVTK